MATSAMGVASLFLPTASPSPKPGQTATQTPSPTPEPPVKLAPMVPNVLLSGPAEYHWHYEYDKLQRVIYACSDWTGALPCAGDEFHYEYDGAGNATRFDRWNTGTSAVETMLYTYNGANQLDTACVDIDHSSECDGNEVAVPYTYDAFGNLTDDGTTTYEYDAANRLASVTVGTNVTSYAYNGDGDRISQTVNGTLTIYLLDTATPLTMVLGSAIGSGA